MGLSQPTFDGEDIYWIELRPKEGGRNVIVKRDRRTESVPISHHLLSMHGPGSTNMAAAIIVVSNGIVYFSNFSDQRLYRQEGPGAPEAADRRRRTCVTPMAAWTSTRTAHLRPRRPHARRCRSRQFDSQLSICNPSDDYGSVLVEGNDFYSSPRVSPDGTQLAWLTWNHPNMPWDGCELWVGEFGEDGTLASTRWVAGGAAESIFQPEWSPDGVLVFCFGSKRLVEPGADFSRRRDRERLSIKGRTGHAAMDVWHVVLRFCFARHDCLQSHRAGCFDVWRPSI